MSCLLACPRRAVHPGAAPARWVDLHSLCINGIIIYIVSQDARWLACLQMLLRRVKGAFLHP